MQILKSPKIQFIINLTSFRLTIYYINGFNNFSLNMIMAKSKLIWILKGSIAGIGFFQLVVGGSSLLFDLSVSDPDAIIIAGGGVGAVVGAFIS